MADDTTFPPSDDPDYPSSEDLIEAGREEAATPIDEKALLEPAEFDDESDEPAEQQAMAFEPSRSMAAVPDSGAAARADVARDLRARLIVGLAIGIVVMIGVVVAALIAAR